MWPKYGILPQIKITILLSDGGDWLISSCDRLPFLLVTRGGVEYHTFHENRIKIYKRMIIYKYFISH